jgi:hypothetical protein
MATAVAALATPVLANAASRTYVFAVTHSHYGRIGLYQRTFDENGDLTQARSKLDIAVKILGLVVHREQIDQVETWRDGHLQSFQSTGDINGRHELVSGEAKAGRFVITTPTGASAAPADVSPADPWAFSKPVHGQVVSIHNGQVDPVDVTGGEAETVQIAGAPVAAHHYRASTPGKPNRWEVWLDDSGSPVKFRTKEPSGSVDFTLVSGPTSGDSGALASR